MKRTVNGDPTYYIYDGDKPILEYRSNGALARNLYGKGIDEILMRYDPAVNGGQWFYYQQDHEGSVTHLTNWNNYNGQIIERYRYDAFGAPTIYAPNWTVRNVSSFNNRFLFTGREYVGAWIYDYRARAYHSGLGRFMSEDPKLFDAGDYNLFRYCHNDPIDFTDPMGLSAGDSINMPPTGTHIPQAMSLDDKLAAMELAGLSTTFAQASLSAQGGVAQALGGSTMGSTPRFSMGYFQYTKGSKKFWESWKTQFSQRWQDQEFRDWWSRAAATRDAYVIGPGANATLPYTMPRAADGSSAAQRASGIRASHQDTGANLTHYGYQGDIYSDSGTRLGLGSRNNILNPDSVSLSLDRAAVTPFGGRVEVNGHFVGFYHDATAPNLTNRVDVYDPNGIFH